MYLICGKTLKDIKTEIRPSDILLSTLLSTSVQFYLRLMSPIVDGILSEKMFLPTA